MNTVPKVNEDYLGLKSGCKPVSLGFHLRSSLSAGSSQQLKQLSNNTLDNNSFKFQIPNFRTESLSEKN